MGLRDNFIIELQTQSHPVLSSVWIVEFGILNYEFFFCFNEMNSVLLEVEFRKKFGRKFHKICLCDNSNDVNKKIDLQEKQGQQLPVACGC